MAGTKVKASKKADGKAKLAKKFDVEDFKRMERKRAKLLARSQELEKEAENLLAKAKKAADKYAELTKALEEQDDTSSESESEEEVDTSSTESTESTGSDSDSSSDGGAAIAALKSKNAKKTTKEQAKPERKRKRTDSDSEDSDSEDSDDTSDSEGEAEEKSSKRKKAKKEGRPKTKKGGKGKKEKKKGREERKMSKAKDTSSDSDNDSDSEEDKGSSRAAAANNKPEGWHVTNLDGGSARQSKFLRLLGGKKQGMSLATAGGDVKSASESTKAEAVIQRQFEEGMKMKNDGGSHRRGLGLGA